MESYSNKVRDKLMGYRKWNLRTQIIALLVIVVSIPVSVWLVRNFYLYLTKAAAIQIYFSPQSETLPPNKTLSLMVDTGSQQLGFGYVEFSFDNSLVNLSSEIQTTDKLGTVMRVTSRNEANSTGKVTIMLGLSTGAAPPSGVFEFARIPLTAVTSQNASTGIVIDNNISQFVDLDLNELTINSSPASLSINSQDIPTATPTTVAIPTQPAPTTVPTEPSTTLSLVSNNSNPKEGQDFTVDVTIDTGGNEVIAAELYINYDTSVLNVFNIAPGSFFTNPDITNKVINNQTGFVSLTLLVPPDVGVPKVGTGTLATLDFNAVGYGTTNITFTQNTLVAATNTGGRNALRLVNQLQINVSRSLIPGDINEDGKVNLLDYSILFEQFALDPPTDLRADINKDGRVNILDYSILFENFGR